jgi:hypothetical protein
MGENGHNRTVYMEKVWRNGLFGIGYPDLWWIELRFILYRDFSRRTSKN